jgi:hypothetical protein
MQTASVELLNNASATGASTAWGGKKGVFAIAGTFGGTTAQLELLGPNGSTWIALASASFTAAGAVVVELPPCRLRVSLTGGTPSAMFASLSAIPE